VTTSYQSRRQNIVSRICGVGSLYSSAVQHRSATLPDLQPEVISMTTISSRVAATAFVSLLLMSSAFAQTTAPATSAPAATPAPKMAPAEKKAEKPRTAASLECSKEADAKGLKGKERKKFRSQCKKAAAEKAK
jgi:CelD/BcsL family acetyltransferase involved in cellulose biosynthesis